MSSKDLRLIRYLEDLQKAGVTGLKVEGRNKSIYYLAIVAGAYRKALESLSNKDLSENKITELENELETVNHRKYTTGFVYGKAIEGEIYDKRIPVRTYDFIGKVKERQNKENTEKSTYIEVRNQIKVGDEIEVITPGKIYRQKVKNIFDENLKEVEIINPGKTDQSAYVELEKVFEYPALLRKKL
jgi:putative protease